MSIMADFSERILDVRLRQSELMCEAMLAGYDLDREVFCEAPDTAKAVSKIQDSIERDFASVKKYLTDQKAMEKYDKNRTKKLSRILDRLNKHFQAEDGRKVMFVGFDPAEYTKNYTAAGKGIARFKKQVCGLKVLSASDTEDVDKLKAQATEAPKRNKDVNAIEYGRTIIEFAKGTLESDESTGPKDVKAMAKAYIEALDKLKTSSDPDVLDVAASIRYVASAEVAVLKGYAKWRESLIKEVKKVDSVIVRRMNDGKTELSFNISPMHVSPVQQFVKI